MLEEVGLAAEKQVMFIMHSAVCPKGSIGLLTRVLQVADLESHSALSRNVTGLFLVHVAANRSCLLLLGASHPDFMCHSVASD